VQVLNWVDSAHSRSGGSRGRRNHRISHRTTSTWPAILLPTARVQARHGGHHLRRLDFVDLSSMTVTGSAVITDGYHNRIDMH